jgi:hypothetical protein
MDHHLNHKVCTEPSILRNKIFMMNFLEKRPKKPLAIVDPVSQKAVELKASTPPSNGSTPSTTDDNHQKDSDTELTNQKSIPPAETTKTKKQEDFRQDFARQLHTNAQTDKV